MTTSADLDLTGKTTRTERLTLALILGTYGTFGLLVFGLGGVSPVLAALLLIPVVAFHGSLSHEAIHGHPFARQAWNDAIMMPSLNPAVPYLRFKDTHLAHHRDEFLTDPYDDPETNYLDPGVWTRLRPWQRRALVLNNTLAGRVLIGPLIGTLAFLAADLRAIRAGAADVRRAWGIHAPVACVLLSLVIISPLPVWAFALAVYGSMSLLKVRTFLEHRAHVLARARTVVVEDRGPLAFLFLNNNLHVVHHMHPKVAWYDLPATYARNRDHYLRRNGGYRYRSYAEVFAQHWRQPKDPVPHPLWQGPDDQP